MVTAWEGGGGSGGDHMVFRKGRWGRGGPVDFGEITWFSGGKMGEGGQSSPTESKVGILENRLPPPIFPIPQGEK